MHADTSPAGNSGEPAGKPGQPTGKSKEKKVWLITGVSRGFGREIARAALAKGDRVIGTTRGRMPQGLDAGDAFRGLTLDVTDSKAIPRVVDDAWKIFGRVDVLVNNAGFGLLGAVEEIAEPQARELFDTNFFGLLNVTRAALPHFREQRSGHILNMSSVGGFSGAPGAGLYHSSKFAVEGLSEALAAEVRPFGIHVTIVEPGFFRTDFLADSSVRFADGEIDAYADSSKMMRKRSAERNQHQPGDPARAAAAIVELSRTPNPPLRLALGADAVERIRAKLGTVGREMERWEPVSLDTSF